jgi:7,8-dihydropterin-6-yl-methyl-4-(beta-D-ribofuranosyl)aminobenzene 5'-phosphate synthase
MNLSPVPLKEVECVEVLTIIDNYVDALLENTDVAVRLPEPKGEEISTDTLVAEHGLSLLVTIQAEGKRRSLLLDTGYTRMGVLHNMGILEIDPDEVEAIVLSHAHMDHTGSLYPLLDRMTGPVTLAVHPEAFQFPRYRELKDGRRLRFPQTLIREDLMNKRVDIRETKTPTPMLDEAVMITGRVPRKTPFEKGLPGAIMERDGKMEEDSVADDQSLVIHLRGKGLVVVTGCCHAGIINTALYAQEISGVRKVYGILGGLHLTGPSTGQVLEKTIAELARLDPKVLVPMHCTGWRATRRLSEAFPEAFILNSVGTKFLLQ